MKYKEWHGIKSSFVPEKEWEADYLIKKKWIGEFSWVLLIILVLVAAVGYYVVLEKAQEAVEDLSNSYVKKELAEKAETEKINAMAQNLDCNYEIWKHELEVE